MGQRLVIGPITKGLRTDLTPFNIDNDNFPTLENAYQWRGRVKRKRGTSFLNRLQRIIGTTDVATGDLTVMIQPTPLLPGHSSFLVGDIFFTDNELDPLVNPVQLLTNSPALASTATLDRSTGQFVITGNNTNTDEDVIYYPVLPVMGLEDLNLPTQNYPGTIGFDTRYAYLINNINPYTPIDISFYKNPAADGVSMPGYVPKTTQTPLWWNGENYRQFGSANYQGAFWETNGVAVPFLTGLNVGMQYQSPSAATGTADPTVVTFTISNCPLVIGDFVFANEFGPKPGAADALNFQTGYVTNVVTVDPVSTVTVKFPFANITNVAYTGGILQYLTNTADPDVDPLRWYEGNGWVNFSPPLSQFAYSINDTPAAQYYLVGARVIFPFKDRQLFFGPIIQRAGNPPIYLQDTCCYSFNGTAFYTSSFTGDPLAFNTPFRQLLVPPNQTADPRAYWEDQTGFGGFRAAGVDQALTSVSPNEDSLICGFRNTFQMRFVYTGNDLQPFDFFIINSELGTASTFSVVNLDEGVMTRSNRGFIITAQTNCRRFDLDIPDAVFQMSNENNGAERVTSQRDFINEWVYFSYSSNDIDNVFPNETLFYNYRDDSWAKFIETYTTYGIFRAIDGYTWETIGDKFPTWESWNETWSAGATTPLKPKVIAGNQQGYIVMRDQGTTESRSLYIQDIIGNVVTCVDHCLNEGDYIIIENAVGPDAATWNGKIFQVGPPPLVDPPVEDNPDQFTINPTPTPTPGSLYLGGGTIKRLYIPKIYSRQFPTAWEMGRKTRLGPQQYMFTRTPQGRITLLIFLSQMDPNASNMGPIYPDTQSVNDSLIYSSVMFTCPESTNMGLTPANVNLQQANSIQSDGSTSNSQQQIWHRMNTSLIGDTVQFGFTLSEEQMRDVLMRNQEVEIEFHSAILDLNPGPWLS